MTEEEIKEAFVTSFNKLVTEREEIAANARLVRQTLCDTTELEREKATLGQELAVLVEMTQNCIAENARVAQETKGSTRNATMDWWSGTRRPRYGSTK